MTPALVPLVTLAPLLLVTIWFDLRFLRIPNVLVGAVVATAIVLAPFLLTWPDSLTRIVVAGVVFAAGFAGFMCRLIGGGDVKMLAALMLFVPLNQMAAFCLLFAAALLIGIGAVQALRAFAHRPGSIWGVLREKHRYPMGLSIGMAGLALPWVMI
jgi:prepilin peptidase CpaA